MTKNEIDFILTDKSDIFQDVKVINKVNICSDHSMLPGKHKLMWKNRDKVERNFSFN